MLERSEEQFPELPMQWRDHGYEIDQRLGKGAYGAVYRLVKNRGADWSYLHRYNPRRTRLRPECPEARRR